MTTQLQEGTVVGVVRKCQACGEWKLLEHYLIRQFGQTDRDGNRTATDSKKVCAACRGRGRKVSA